MESEEIVEVYREEPALAEREEIAMEPKQEFRGPDIFACRTEDEIYKAMVYYSHRPEEFEARSGKIIEGKRQEYERVISLERERRSFRESSDIENAEQPESVESQYDPETARFMRPSFLSRLEVAMLGVRTYNLNEMSEEERTKFQEWISRTPYSSLKRATSKITKGVSDLARASFYRIEDIIDRLVGLFGSSTTQVSYQPSSPFASQVSLPASVRNYEGEDFNSPKNYQPAKNIFNLIT